jgi:HEAT repeat protein
MMDTDPKDLEALVAHLEELTEATEEDHTPEFLAHIVHDAPVVRAIAVRGLWDSDPREVLEPLWRVAEQDADEEVRATAVSVMGRYVYEGLLLDDGDDELAEVEPSTVTQVRSFLEGLLYDEKQPELVRRRALEALAFDPGPEEMTLMEKWAKSPSPSLRMTAIFSMGRSALESWEKPILRAIDDPDRDVRREAIRAVGEACLETGLPRLERIIEGDDRELMLEAISALGEVGGERAMARLEELIESEDEEVSEVAQLALEEAEIYAEELAGLDDGYAEDDEETDDR